MISIVLLMHDYHVLQERYRVTTGSLNTAVKSLILTEMKFCLCQVSHCCCLCQMSQN